MSKSNIFTLFSSLVFLVFTLILLNPFNNTNIISPLGIQGQTDKLMNENVSPKLSAVKNTYSLESQTQLVKQAEASDLANGSSEFIVTDFNSGKILASKNSQTPVPIASLTKIMTAVVALDLAKAEEKFTVSTFASQVEPTRIGVVPGQRMSLHELLEAMLMTSANDAAQVVREGINEKYGAQIFVRAMNEKAKFLGLKNTLFSNPQGFDSENNYSTAYDLAILSHYALTNYPMISDIVKKDYAFIPADQNHKQFDLYNWNGLLDVYPDTMGIKIGNTTAASYTMIALSQRNGQKILAVVLGAPDIYSRDLIAANLLDTGYAQTLNLPPVNVTKQELQQKYATWKYF